MSASELWQLQGYTLVERDLCSVFKRSNKNCVLREGLQAYNVDLPYGPFHVGCHATDIMPYFSVQLDSLNSKNEHLADVVTN